MPHIGDILAHTPVWVWALLAFLVFRGVAALKPAETTLPGLAILPLVLLVWGVVTLVETYGTGLSAFGPWLLAAVAGAVAGHGFVRRMAVAVDRGRGTIRRPADPTVLPLVLVVFAVKYVAGVAAAVAPGLLERPDLRLLVIAISGLSTGFFVGKFIGYVRRFRSAPRPLG